MILINDEWMNEDLVRSGRYFACDRWVTGYVGSARVMDNGPMDISEWRSSVLLCNVIWGKVTKT